MYGGFNIIPRNPHTNTQRLFNENREIMSLSFVGIDYDIDTSNNLLTINHPQMGTTIVTTSLGESMITTTLTTSFVYNIIFYDTIDISLTLGTGDLYDISNNTITVSSSTLISELNSNLKFTGNFYLNGNTLYTAIGDYTNNSNVYSSNDGELRDSSGNLLSISSGNTITFNNDAVIYDDVNGILFVSNIAYVTLNSVEYHMSLNNGVAVTILDNTEPISNIDVNYNGYYEQSNIIYTTSFITLTINEDCTWFELMLNFYSSTHQLIDIKIGETVLINIDPLMSIYLKLAKVNNNFIII